MSDWSASPKVLQEIGRLTVEDIAKTELIKTQQKQISELAKMIKKLQGEEDASTSGDSGTD